MAQSDAAADVGGRGQVRRAALEQAIVIDGLVQQVMGAGFVQGKGAQRGPAAFLGCPAHHCCGLEHLAVDLRIVRPKGEPGLRGVPVVSDLVADLERRGEARRAENLLEEAYSPSAIRLDGSHVVGAEDLVAAGDLGDEHRFEGVQAMLAQVHQFLFEPGVLRRHPRRVKGHLDGSRREPERQHAQGEFDVGLTVSLCVHPGGARGTGPALRLRAPSRSTTLGRPRRQGGGSRLVARAERAASATCEPWH